MNPVTLRFTLLSALLGGALTAPLVAWQNPAPPVEVIAAKARTPAEGAAQMTGAWKLNEELSPLPRAGSSPAAGSVTDRGRRGGGGGGGFGGGGRGGATGAITQVQQQELRMRALYRELSVRPSTLTITATAATVKFVDEEGLERVVTANTKKEDLDLGTSIVDSKTSWNGAALTIELDAGSQLKLFEVFEVSPTGKQLLVTLKTENGSNARAGQQPSNVQRVYDRIS